jgi:surfactin synthase thioesterase subunit
VAPPVFLLEGAPLAEFHGSLHVLVGDADEYAEPEALEAELARSPAARHMHWLAGADHFFLGSNVVALGERLRALVPEAPAR